MTKEQFKKLKAIKGIITIQDGYCNTGRFRFKVDGLDDGSFRLPKSIKNPFIINGDCAIEDETGFEEGIDRRETSQEPFPALGDKIGEVNNVKGLYIYKNYNRYTIKLKNGYFYLTDGRFMIKKKTTCPDSFSRDIDLSLYPLFGDKIEFYTNGFSSNGYDFLYEPDFLNMNYDYVIPDKTEHEIILKDKLKRKEPVFITSEGTFNYKEGIISWLGNRSEERRVGKEC